MKEGFQAFADEWFTLESSTNDERNQLVPRRNSDLTIKKRLDRLTPENIFPGRKILSKTDALCVLSALYDWYDFLDDSHKCSQEIKTMNGSFWHGIMHRREPDYPNAKYWFQHVDHHPIYPVLAAKTTALKGAKTFLALRNDWDPFAFVDLCEQAVKTKNPMLDTFCRAVQKTEFDLLLEHCWIASLGQTKT